MEFSRQFYLQLESEALNFGTENGNVVYLHADQGSLFWSVMYHAQALGCAWTFSRTGTGEFFFLLVCFVTHRAHITRPDDSEGWTAEFVEAMGREREPSCLELQGLACKASCDCDFVAKDEDELTRHRIEVHGLSGDDAVQNPKWPCCMCLQKLDKTKYDCSGEVCPACTWSEGGRRKPYKLERAEDKLRIAKWRREKGYVE